MGNIHNNKQWRGFDKNINLASRVCRISDHNTALEKLKKECSDAHAYLTAENLPRHTWARSHFDPSTKCENVSNNWTEAFNAWIHEARDMPICKAVRLLHGMTMDMRWKRMQIAEKMGDFEAVQRVNSWVKEVCVQKAKDWIVRGCDGRVWAVEGPYSSYTVDLERKTCNCLHWEHTGIPCVHAICVIARNSTPERIDWGR